MAILWKSVPHEVPSADIFLSEHQGLIMMDEGDGKLQGYDWRWKSRDQGKERDGHDDGWMDFDTSTFFFFLD